MPGIAQVLDENARLRALLDEREQVIATQSRRLDEQQAQIGETRAQLEENQRLVAERDAKLAIVLPRLEELERYIELEALRRQTPASERYVPDNQVQLPLPGDIAPPPRLPEPMDDDESSEDEDDEERATRGKRRGKKKPGDRRRKPRRRRLQDLNLPKRKVICAADPDASCAGCGGALKVIGQAVSRRLNWIPGHFVVDEIERDKCACSDCPGEGVLAVPVPAALPRAMCGDGLLAKVIVDKYADHIPLDRQRRRMKREGVEIGTATLSNWVKSSAELFGLLARAIRRQVFESASLLGDDTGLPVQDGTDGKLRKGRLWVFTDQQQAWFAFTATKQGIFPAHLLEEYEGERLLVDGGSEFNLTVRQHELERGGCWSHLRRYFFEARHHHPGASAAALRTIRDLYHLEEGLKDKPPERILDVRQRYSKPLVDGFFVWVRSMSTHTRPTSMLGKALGYARNQESEMRLHLDHPDLPMHNNLSELMLRQPVVGRKNWLFAGSQGGAEAACIHYTLVNSCMLQGIDPHAYLVDVLARLPDHPANRVGELTPRNWRLAREAASHG